jgi:hypothetical protein
MRNITLWPCLSCKTQPSVHTRPEAGRGNAVPSTNKTAVHKSVTMRLGLFCGNDDGCCFHRTAFLGRCKTFY